MRLSKKHLLAGVLLAFAAALLATQYRPVPPGAREVGSAKSCEASCPTGPPEDCFCVQSCILFYCWGPFYCQCRP